jgi:hypothetical protein
MTDNGAERFESRSEYSEAQSKTMGTPLVSPDAAVSDPFLTPSPIKRRGILSDMIYLSHGEERPTPRGLPNTIHEDEETFYTKMISQVCSTFGITPEAYNHL